MHTGDTTDVTSTLTDLERKLVDLERELSAVAGGAAPGGAPAPPAEPAETRDATLRVEDLRGEIGDLVRFRDQLEAAARELVTEYDRLVDRLRGAEPAGADSAHAGLPLATQPPAPPPSLGPRPEPTAPATTGWTPEPLPAAVAAGLGSQAATPPPAPAVNETLSFVGAVVVDAGPFTDITTLQAFEQGLGRVEGAEDVYVRSFEGDRALIDVRLSNPVPLVQLLRESLPLPIIPREAGEGRLTVDVVAADSHGT